MAPRVERRTAGSARHSELVTFVGELLRSAAAGEKLENLVSSILQAAAHLCRARMAALSLHRADALEVVGAYGAPGGIHGTRLPLATSMHGVAVVTGRTFRCADARSAKEKWLRASAERNDVRGVCVVPVQAAGASIGALSVVKRTAWRCTADDEGMLKLLANLTTIVLELDRKQGQTRPVEAGLDDLGAKEREIVKLLIADKTQKEIGEATGLSERTIGHYVERLKLRFRKSTMHGLVGAFVPPAPSALSGRSAELRRFAPIPPGTLRLRSSPRARE